MGLGLQLTASMACVYSKNWPKPHPRDAVAAVGQTMTHSLPVRVRDSAAAALGDEHLEGRQNRSAP